MGIDTRDATTMTVLVHSEQPPRASDTRWWRNAVIYQIYPRSFHDANGDGVGDLRGVCAKLPYLRELGIDALWFTPWYKSPMADGGYDIEDYREIDPAFGTLADAEELIRSAHEQGLRIIIDVVPNHCSDRHAWFRQALAGAPGSEARERFWFRAGRGTDGQSPPNDWRSEFGGPAWTRVPNPDGSLGEWYLHLFAAEQPDFNWNSPKVREEFEEVLRFWFDRGVDGVRIDSATMPFKDPALPDLADVDRTGGRHPFVDQDGVHAIYRHWRTVADSYPRPRALIGEVWLADPVRFAAYLQPDEMHTAFNFDYLNCPWDAARFRTVIDETLESHRPAAAPATWVLSNHDVTRHITRYGRADSSKGRNPQLHGAPTDVQRGTRRGRAALLLNLALPGSCYIYQGEELGLTEVSDLPDEARQDPYFFRSKGADIGRDGCRVPIPWEGQEPPFGFSPGDAQAAPWLPQPSEWRNHTAELLGRRPDSILSLYRDALRIRRSDPAFRTDEFEWVSEPESEVLEFARSTELRCLVNLSAEPVALPGNAELILSSIPLADPHLLPEDTAAWLRLPLAG